MAEKLPVLAVASLEGALLALVSGQETDHPLAGARKRIEEGVSLSVYLDAAPTNGLRLCL
jgi:hypothetical protein